MCVCGWFGLVRCECLDNIFVWLCLALIFSLVSDELLVLYD